MSIRTKILQRLEETHKTGSVMYDSSTSKHVKVLGQHKPEKGAPKFKEKMYKVADDFSSMPSKQKKHWVTSHSNLSNGKFHY